MKKRKPRIEISGTEKQIKNLKKLSKMLNGTPSHVVHFLCNQYFYDLKKLK